MQLSPGGSIVPCQRQDSVKFAEESSNIAQVYVHLILHERRDPEQDLDTRSLKHPKDIHSCKCGCRLADRMGPQSSVRNTVRSLSCGMWHVTLVYVSSRCYNSPVGPIDPLVYDHLVHKTILPRHGDGRLRPASSSEPARWSDKGQLN
ncbi:hypothetical protein ABW21_db0201696 [Orbilia brochopaga]|nr:hypothetical protein ABW21_db0201696 [Drechslerella brochopaga]